MRTLERIEEAANVLTYVKNAGNQPNQENSRVRHTRRLTLGR